MVNGETNETQNPMLKGVEALSSYQGIMSRMFIVLEGISFATNLVLINTKFRNSFRTIELSQAILAKCNAKMD